MANQSSEPSSKRGSTLSTSAATFVPGQTLSPGAATFVPSARATEFEPFVPQQTTWAPSAAEFVPGQSGWGTGSEQSSWHQSYGFGSAGSSMYGASQFVNSSATPYTLGSGVQCMVNLDGYSTDSDSSPSPREGPRDDKASESHLPPKAEDRGPSIESVLAEDDKCVSERPQVTSDSNVLEKSPPLDIDERQGVEKNIGVDEVRPTLDTLIPESTPIPSRSPSMSPPKTFDSEPHLPPEAVTLEEGRSATTSDNEVEDFKTPTGVEHLEDCPLVEATISAERSERTLKQWVQRFANDHDSELFGLQWHKWTSDGVGEPEGEITAWMLRYGLEDWKGATPVCSALDWLLREEGLLPATVKSALSEFSEEDLADLELDNPKVRDFVSAVEKILTNLPAICKPKRRPVQDCPETNGSVDDSTCDASYTLDTLIQIRRRLLQTGEIDEYSGPCWATESATKSCGPMPSWQQNRLARRTGETTGEPGSREWRDAQKRNSENRKGRDEKKSGKSGPRKESITISETSWMAQTKRWKAETKKDDIDEGALVDEQFLREMRLTLNKLTVEKFDHLSDHLIELISQSTRPNRGIPVLMQLVFEKATTQHHFIDMYVNLCVKLHKWLMAHNDIVRAESQTNFKRILLNQCQSSFESYLEPPGTLEGLTGDGLYEAQVKYKTKMLGNIKLVGQLICHGMLSPKIALSVATELVQDDPMVREERLETLAVFLETIGPALDDPNWSHAAQFDAIFTEVRRLSTDKSLTSRIRFIMRDVLDLRHGNWQTSKVRQFDEDAPTTIAEVHEKAKLVVAVTKSSGKGSPKGSPIQSDSPQKGKRKSTTSSKGNNENSSKPATSSKGNNENSRRAESPKYRPLQLLKRSSTEPADTKYPSSNDTRNAEQVGDRLTGSPEEKSKGDLLTGLQRAVDDAGTKATKPKEEILASFHKEITQIIRQVCDTLSIGESVQRLREFPLPSECVHEEVVDLIARMIDEPKERRQHMFPLLAALFDAGVFYPPSVLGVALASFIEDAFQDPGNVDPPDLVDIILRELLPVLGLRLTSLNIAPYISELFAEMDDGG